MAAASSRRLHWVSADLPSLFRCHVGFLWCDTTADSREKRRCSPRSQTGDHGKLLSRGRYGAQGARGQDTLRRPGRLAVVALGEQVNTEVHECRLSRCAAARFLLYAMALLALGDSICHLCASHTLTRD